MKSKLLWLELTLILFAPWLSNAVPGPIQTDLAMGKTASTNSVRVGDQFTFELSVTNLGPENATNVVVFDVLPPAFAFVSSSGDGTYDAPNGFWSVPVSVGGTVSILGVTVQAAATGTFTNTADILGSGTFDPNAANNSASAAVTVQLPQADLAIAKTASTNNLGIGEQVIFTLSLENLGPDNLTNDIVTTDCLPPGFSYITDSTVGGGGDGTYSPGTCLWTLPGGLETNLIVHLQITAMATGLGVYTNTATVAAPPEAPDPDLSNNSAYAVVAIVSPQADLSVVKTITNAPIFAGDNIRYQLVISNAGSADLTNVFVVDYPDPGLSVNGAFLGTNASFSFQSNTFTIFSLPAGSSADIEIWARVVGAGMLTNLAVVPVPPGVVDPDTNNNFSVAVINATPTADLGVAKLQNTNFVAVGQPILFTVELKNYGPNTSSNIVVQDVIPAGVTLTASNVPAGTTFNPANGNWAVPLLASNATRVLQLTLVMTNGGTITNTAVIVATALYDPFLLNNTNSVTGTWLPAVYTDLAITLEPSTNVLRVGGTFTLDVTVTNIGPNNASNVIVLLPVPTNAVFVTQVGLSKWTYNPITGVASRPDTLFVGFSSTFTIRYNTTNAGTISFAAQITNSQPVDPIMANNFASTNVVVLPVFSLSGSVVNCVTNGPPLAGLTVTLTTSNQPMQSVITGTNGAFVFTNLIPATYIVTVVTNIYSFTPSNQVITLVSNTNLPPFVAAAQFVSGTVRQGTNGSPVPNVMIRLSGNASRTNATDAKGVFIFTNLTAGTYVVTPLTNGLPGIRFTPNSVTNVLGSSTNCPVTANFVTTNLLIVLRALEVVQVVQDWSNSVPLVANKATLIRAHLQLFGTNTQPILVENARLYAQNLGGGASADWVPDNGRITVRTNDSTSPVLRSNINATLNFTVRNGWTTGQDTFRFSWTNGVVINIEPRDAAGDPASNGMVRANFTPVPPLGVRFIRVAFTNGLVTNITATATNILPLTNVPTAAEIDEQKRRVISIYPIVEITNLAYGYFFWNSRAMGAPTNESRLLQRLNAARLTSSDTNGVATNRIWYGVVSKNAILRGLGYQPGHTSEGNISASPLDYQRHLAAHEIGHNLGRPHSVHSSFGQGACPAGNITGHCNECAAAATPDFPMYLTAGSGLMPTLGPLAGDDGVIWGYDHYLLQVISPYFYYDLMSYCAAHNAPNPAQTGQWPWNSKHTYTNLFNTIRTRFGPAPAPIIQGEAVHGAEFVQSYLLVSGEIDFDSNSVVFHPSYPIDNPFPVTPGDYILRVLDTNAEPLLDIPFEPEVPQNEFDSQYNVAAFNISVPFLPDAAGLQILSNGVPIGELLADAYAPVVQILQPNGGEVFGNTNIIVSWTASDLDSSTLTYLVQFSHDGGNSWDTLGIDLDQTNLDIPPDTLLATTNGLIRVAASDGFHTYTAQSAGFFTVNPHAPIISILQPAFGSLFFGDQTIVFQAAASALEDGPLDGTNILWSSSLDGPFGNGATLPLETSSLSEGIHVVTAIAFANSGLTNSASVEITVLRLAPPQLAIALAGDQVQLSWPAIYTNYILERTTLLAPASWESVTNAPVVVDDQQTVTVDVSPVSQFFRLRLLP